MIHFWRVDASEVHLRSAEGARAADLQRDAYSVLSARSHISPVADLISILLVFFWKAVIMLGYGDLIRRPCRTGAHLHGRAIDWSHVA